MASEGKRSSWYSRLSPSRNSLGPIIPQTDDHASVYSREVDEHGRLLKVSKRSSVGAAMIRAASSMMTLRGGNAGPSVDHATSEPASGDTITASSSDTRSPDDAPVGRSRPRALSAGLNMHPVTADDLLSARDQAADPSTPPVPARSRDRPFPYVGPSTLGAPSDSMARCEAERSALFELSPSREGSIATRKRAVTLPSGRTMDPGPIADEQPLLASKTLRRKRAVTFRESLDTSPIAQEQHDDSSDVERPVSPSDIGGRRRASTCVSRLEHVAGGASSDAPGNEQGPSNRNNIMAPVHADHIGPSSRGVIETRNAMPKPRRSTLSRIIFGLPNFHSGKSERKPIISAPQAINIDENPDLDRNRPAWAPSIPFLVPDELQTYCGEELLSKAQNTTDQGEKRILEAVIAGMNDAGDRQDSGESKKRASVAFDLPEDDHDQSPVASSSKTQANGHERIDSAIVEGYEHAQSGYWWTMPRKGKAIWVQYPQPDHGACVQTSTGRLIWLNHHTDHRGRDSIDHSIDDPIDE